MLANSVARRGRQELPRPVADFLHKMRATRKHPKICDQHHPRG